MAKKNNRIQFPGQAATPAPAAAPQIAFSTPGETAVLIYFDQLINTALARGISILTIQACLLHLIARLNARAIADIPVLPATVPPAAPPAPPK